MTRISPNTPPAARSRAILAPDALLDAAEAVICRESVSRLTLDAVAREAGASKGGLIHHFASKEKLIEALVNRVVANWRSDVLAAIAAMPQGPGRVPRAMLQMVKGKPIEWTDQCHRSCRAMTAALFEFPTLVEPMRAFQRELNIMIDADGLPPGVSEVVMRTLDGLWFMSLLGVNAIEDDRGVFSILDRLVTDSLAPARRASPQTPARSKARVPRAQRNIIKDRSVAKAPSRARGIK